MKNEEVRQAVKKDEIDLPQRTKRFALMIIRLYSSLPKKTEAQVLGAQLLRSGTGAGANYREAHRARSKAEFIAKCGDALRELEESAYWMELLVEGDIVQPEALLSVAQECNELTAIFVTIINRAKRR
jgi:four helix bundle protein